jgi:hypothetical protein
MEATAQDFNTAESAYPRLTAIFIILSLSFTQLPFSKKEGLTCTNLSIIESKMS